MFFLSWLSDVSPCIVDQYHRRNKRWIWIEEVLLRCFLCWCLFFVLIMFQVIGSLEWVSYVFLLKFFHSERIGLHWVWRKSRVHHVSGYTESWFWDRVETDIFDFDDFICLISGSRFRCTVYGSRKGFRSWVCFQVRRRSGQQGSLFAPKYYSSHWYSVRASLGLISRF